jgi:hypothetical protein
MESPSAKVLRKVSKISASLATTDDHFQYLVSGHA